MPRDRSEFEKDIRAAIPLLRVDPASADRMLVKIHRRAKRARDTRASLWALQLLQMLVGVTGRDPERYVRICREVVRVDPRRAMSWVFLGSAEGAVGRERAAAEAFREAITLSRRDPETARCARQCLEELRPVRRPVRPRRARSRASARRD